MDELKQNLQEVIEMLHIDGEPKLTGLSGRGNFDITPTGLKDSINCIYRRFKSQLKNLNLPVFSAVGTRYL